MTHRIQLEPALILHRRAYRDTSYIVDLFTQSYGRITALAKSARGPKSRYRGKLEFFFPLLVSWSGRRELKILGDVELREKPYLLGGDALLCGFYINELLARLLNYDDPHPRLFGYYQEALEKLQKKDPLENTLRRFEKRLLEELGYGLPLQGDAETGRPFEAESCYQFVPERGFLRSDLEDGIFIFNGKTLVELRDEQFDNERILKDAKRLMRLALGRLLTKSLNSYELF